MSDIRYTLEHSGDYIADVLDKAAGITGKAAEATWSATKSVAKKLPLKSISLPSISLKSFSGGSIKGALSRTTEFTWSMTKNVSGLARGSARGVILTYDINRLKKEKRGLIRQLGERFLKVYTETSRPDLSEDADAAPILTRLAEVEKTLAAFVEERSERLYPKTRPPAEIHAEEAAAPDVDIPGAEAAVPDEEALAPESYASEAVVEEAAGAESRASEAVAPDEHHAETEAHESADESEPAAGLI